MHWPVDGVKHGPKSPSSKQDNFVPVQATTHTSIQNRHLYYIRARLLKLRSDVPPFVAWNTAFTDAVGLVGFPRSARL